GVEEARSVTAAKSPRGAVSAPASDHATYRQVIERRDRIRVGPQSHAAQLEPCISVLEVPLAVEQRVDTVTDRKDAHRVPLPERRRLDVRARQLSAASVVVVEPKVVLE